MEVRKYQTTVELHDAKGETATATDNGNKAEGQIALEEFRREEPINADGKIFPFHAVDYIIATDNVQVKTVDDDTCKASGSGGGGSEDALTDENDNPLTDENGNEITG